MNIIFLDIDGVISTPTTCVAFNTTMWRIDPTLALVIKRLCIDTDATLVISSTWRIGHTRRTFSDLLTAYDLNSYLYMDKFLWKTPELHGEMRGDEVRAWFTQYKLKNPAKTIDNWIIIDDETDFYDDQDTHFIRTNYKYGFTYEQFYEARMMLGFEAETSAENWGA